MEQKPTRRVIGRNPVVNTPTLSLSTSSTTSVKLPTFREWAGEFTGTPNVLFEATDEEFAELWARYVRDVFGGNKDICIQAARDWESCMSSNQAHVLGYLDKASKNLIQMATKGISITMSTVSLGMVGGGAFSVPTFDVYLAKFGINVRQISEIPFDVVQEWWMYYIAHLEEINPGYRPLIVQFFPEPPCHTKGANFFIEKCRIAIRQIEYNLGIYKECTDRLTEIEWVVRCPLEDCCPITSPKHVIVEPKEKPEDVFCEGTFLVILPDAVPAPFPVKHTWAGKGKGSDRHAERIWYPFANEVWTGKVLKFLETKCGGMEPDTTTTSKKKLRLPKVICRLEVFVSFECCEPCQVEFAAKLSKSMSVTAGALKLKGVEIVTEIYIWTYWPYQPPLDKLYHRFFQARNGQCQLIYRAPKHPYMLQAKADVLKDKK